MIVMQILLRVRFDETDKVGIRRLLNDYSYLACFPLHEGRYDKSERDGKILDRRVRILFLEGINYDCDSFIYVIVAILGMGSTS